MALTQSHDDDAFDDPGLGIVFAEQHPDYKVRKQNVRLSSISADQSNHLSSSDALAPICIATKLTIKPRETSLHLSLIPATEAGLPCTKNSNVLGFVHHIVEELNRSRRQNMNELPADGEGDVSGEDCGGGDSITGLLGDTRLDGTRAGGVDGAAGDVGGDETGAGVGLGGGTGGGLFGGGGGGDEEEENGGDDGDTTEGDGDNEGEGVGTEDGDGTTLLEGGGGGGGGDGGEDGEVGLFVGLVGGGVAGGGEF